MKQIFSGLGQLLQINPVLSWGISSFILGFGIAVYQAGFNLQYSNGLLGLVLIVLILGFVSHGLNDAYDWITGVDKGGEGIPSRGSDVVHENKISVAGLIIISVAAIGVSLAITYYLYLDYGVTLLVLILVGIWSAVGYSTPPFKMSYRPFNELIVGLPAITCVVILTELLLVGNWTWLSVGLGITHGMFGISWFIISRVPDYEVDKKYGKNTSVVVLGKDQAPLLSGIYATLALIPASIFAVTTHPVTLLSYLFWVLILIGLANYNPDSDSQSYALRMRNMHLTTLHGTVFGVILVAIVTI